MAFAIHLLILGTTARRHDPVRLAAIQVGLVGVACAGPGLAMGGYRFPAVALAAAVGTALVATAGAFVLQISGQRTVAPARAALLLLLEPVFAAVLAEARGDGLRLVQLAGGATILAAIVLAEVVPPRLDQAVRSREALDNDRSQGEWVG